MALSSRNSAYLTPKECEHLTNYKANHGAKGYDLIKDYIKISPCGRIVVDRSKLEVPRCSFCDNNQGRLYLCLICSSVSCSDLAESDHAHMHCQSFSGHDIAVHMDSAELYCVLCSDQVYDAEFDEAVLGLPRRNGNDVTRSSKRKRLSFGVDLDVKSMKRLASLRDQYSKSCFPLGLRGLNNLGSTCFMNSVLQAFLHAPPLRNYFLSNRHDRQMCRKTSPDSLCLPCDIDVIFSAVFSGDRMPYSPAQFLYSWWQQSENLANYEQQDAHEFFISMLDRFHEKEAKASPAIGDNRDCTCIIHKSFAGLLRSDLTCTSCGSTSSTYDPCVDISLDLDTSNSRLRDLGKPSKQNENVGMSTLVGCLDLFTRPEKLGSYQKLYCENCQEKQDTLKQMSIKKLPLVLCLHIKRFEHSPVKRLSRKIDRHLQFPFSLDMRPYLSSSIVRKRLGNRMVALEEDELETNTEFEVFAVVTHSGMLESGHYATYLRLMNQWFKCDDAWITKVSEEVVRASQCYLIYYVQKTLHKESEDMSCQPISPRTDAFVPIAGCC